MTASNSVTRDATQRARQAGPVPAGLAAVPMMLQLLAADLNSLPPTLMETPCPRFWC